VTFELRPHSVDEPRPDAVETGLSAWEDDHCVGEVGSLGLDVTVPGGARLTTTALTRLSVASTHLDRGVHAELVERFLAEAQLAGFVAASTGAAEEAVFGQYGFASASDTCSVTIDPRRARPIHRPAEGSVRALAIDEVATVLPDLYDRCARHRAGTISRSDTMWQRQLQRHGDSGSHLRVDVHDDSVHADGYVRYALPGDDPGGPVANRVGTVIELFGTDAAVERALWEHLMSIEGVDEWRAEQRPVDDPLRLAAADPRSVRVEGRNDEHWLRLLDVDTAIGARTYGPTDRCLTIQVRDPLFSSNCGTWRIDSYGAFRSHNEPELVADVSGLSAAYLGGTSWRELHEAGRVHERRSGAVTDADALFAHRPEPFCGTSFQVRS
jgi:predicted acetyltransferase